MRHSKRRKKLSKNNESTQDMIGKDRKKEWSNYSILSFEYYERKKWNEAGESHGCSNNQKTSEGIAN